MQGSPQSIPLDLDRYSESTRRQLYDLLRTNHFTCREVNPRDSEPLPYSAEEADLSVMYVYGRWLAIWTSQEAEGERVEIFRIKPTTENALGVMLHEC
jgi:hypothetical protein